LLLLLLLLFYFNCIGDGWTQVINMRKLELLLDFFGSWAYSLECFAFFFSKLISRILSLNWVIFIFVILFYLLLAMAIWWKHDLCCNFKAQPPASLVVLFFSYCASISIFWLVFTYLQTCRDEIAGCSEKAYDYLSIKDAKQMLLFSSDQELLEYIKEVNYVLTP